MKKKELDSIKSKLLSRGFSLAKITLQAGTRAASHSLSQWAYSREEKDDRLSRYLTSQIQMLAGELGQLKGSLMKAGQLLSTYGEHFLPPEANEVLKSLQYQSPPVKFALLQPVLVRELGEDKLAELEIDPKPFAAASLGQVHRARRLKDGQELALKIQYPDVDKAIASDLRFLKLVLSTSKLIPRGPRFDQIFAEVKAMLEQEVNYENELNFTQDFADKLKEDPRYRVPQVFPEYSGQRVLTTQFMEGLPSDNPEVLALPLERRNRLGQAYLELYLRELFDFACVQTDPHFGNYRIELDPEGRQDRLILLDFGAVRQVEPEFLKPYQRLVMAALNKDGLGVQRAGEDLGLLKDSDPPELVEKYLQLCFLITEPFYGPEAYDWGSSDLPQRVAKVGADLVASFHLRSPPHQTVFLDRKLGGTFVFLSKLGCQAQFRSSFAPWITS